MISEGGNKHVCPRRITRVSCIGLGQIIATAASIVSRPYYDSFYSPLRWRVGFAAVRVFSRVHTFTASQARVTGTVPTIGLSGAFGFGSLVAALRILFDILRESPIYVLVIT